MPIEIVSPGYHFCCSGRREALHASIRAKAARPVSLALQVDAGLRAEAEVLHEGRDGVDAHVVGEHVVVRVGGHHDRLEEVDA